ncbi:hypothetical protein ACNKHW_06515 [Shigella flexneri]
MANRCLNIIGKNLPSAFWAQAYWAVSCSESATLRFPLRCWSRTRKSSPGVQSFAGTGRLFCISEPMSGID